MPLANRFMVWLLASPVRGLAGGRVAAIRYQARSGAAVVLPVQAARVGAAVVVMAGNAARKRWWRHFTAPAAVQVLLDGAWHGGTGSVVVGADSTAADAYRRAFARMAVPADATFVVIDLDGTLAAPPPLRGRPLLRSWMWTVTAAEFVGFAVPASVGALTASSSPVASVPALLAAGAIEGSLLGLGQASVLRRALAGFRRRPWILATATGAVIAYAIALMPSTFYETARSWPVGVLAGAGVVLGGALLASIGTAQWFILRRHIADARRWIWVTAIAWLIGLGVFLVFTMPLWQAGQPLALTVLVGIAGGLLMAAVTSAATGVALRRLLP